MKTNGQKAEQFINEFIDLFFIKRNLQVSFTYLADNIIWRGCKETEYGSGITEVKEVLLKNKREIGSYKTCLSMVSTKADELSAEVCSVTAEFELKAEHGPHTSQSVGHKFLVRTNAIVTFRGIEMKIASYSYQMEGKNIRCVKNDKYKNFFENAEALIVRCCFDNNTLCGIVGYDCDTLEVIYQKTGLGEMAGNGGRHRFTGFEQLYFPEDKERLQLQTTCCILARKRFEFSFRIQKEDLSAAWLQIKGNPYQKTDGSLVMMCTYTDISDLKNAQFEREKEKERYMVLLNTTDDIFFEYDIKQDLMTIVEKTAQNQGGVPFRHYIRGYLKKLDDAHIIHPDDADKIKSVCNGKLLNEFEFRMSRKESAEKYIWMKYFGSVVLDAEGRPKEVVGVVRNIHETKEAEQKLIKQSMTDPLTNLYNKVITEKLITKSLRKLNRMGVLMILDIDDFKTVNDNLGHLFGDAVLRNVSAKIKAIFTDADIIGRIGGDEFLIFMPDTEGLEKIRMKAEQLCQELRNTYAGDVKNSGISVSIGIACAPDHGSSYVDLFNKADLALYQVKSIGKNSYCIYDETMEFRGGEDKALFNANIVQETKQETKDEYLPDKIVADIFKLLISTKDTSSAINMILSMISNAYHISRCYIYENSGNGQHTSNTYEWCSQGIKAEKDMYKNIPMNECRACHHLYDSKGIYYCGDTEALKELDARFYGLCVKQKVRALLQCKISDNGEEKGYVGFDDCSAVREWSGQEIETLNFISQILGSYLLKLRSKEQQAVEHFFSQALISHLDLYIYTIDPESYMLQYIGQKMYQRYPLLAVGALCYREIKGQEQTCVNCPALGLTGSRTRYSIRTYDKSLNSWLEISATKIKDSNGKDLVMISSQDVTSYVQRLSDSDDLTSAPTLNKFEQAAREIIKENAKTSYLIAYLDIAGFKYINETYGFSVGNMIIINLANELARCTGNQEYYARVNADKFVALFKSQGAELDKERLQHLNEHIQKNVGREVEGQGIKFVVGIYYINGDSAEISTMLDKANIARKSVQSVHRNAVAVYDSQMELRENSVRMIEMRMDKALKNREFVVYLQPKMNLLNLEIMGAEALVRWFTEEDKIIYPNEFIPVFERNGFITNLDFYVYDVVCRLLHTWISENKKPIVVSVNVSRAHINNQLFIENLLNLTKKYNIPSELLELELTESLFLDNVERVIAVMTELHNLGFKVSIDDFGSGYSSLNLLKELPVDVLKLDKAFFSGDRLKEKEIILVKSIINLAKELKIKVICEGVETEEQAAFLKSAGCDYGQGYLFSRPISIQEFEEKYRLPEQTSTPYG